MFIYRSNYRAKIQCIIRRRRRRIFVLSLFNSLLDSAPTDFCVISGVTQQLYNKWWKSPGLTCSRDEKNKEGKANALGIGNIGGVFVVLLIGLAFAILTAIFEFIWNARNNSQVRNGKNSGNDSSFYRG